MSGLFHRLAQQAVGSEPGRVHTVTRLPFVSPPETGASPEGMAAPADDRTHTTISPSTPSASAARAADMPDAVPPDANRRQAGARPATKGASRRTTTFDDPSSSSERQASEPVLSGSEDVIDHTLSSMLDESIPTSVVADSAATPDSAFSSQAESRRRATVGSASAMSPGEGESDSRMPAPIIAPIAAAGAEHAATRRLVSAPGVRERGGWLPVSTAADGEATEVHVHIGRIEVTATQEAASPRRQPAAGPKPMSLDEYLARRRSES